jgi:hypothetical protein
MARATPPALIRHLGEASDVLGAASKFLEAIANLLRQLVHLVGWIVLLDSSINLLLDPHLSSGHLAVPGAGALAVLQGLIRPWRRREATNLVIGPDETPLPQIDSPSDVGTLQECTPGTGTKMLSA